MTEYGHSITKSTHPTPLLSRNGVDEKKAARKKLLEEVFRRRAENYVRFMRKKRRLQTGGDLVTIA